MSDKRPFEIKPPPVMLVNMTVDSVRGGGTAERTRQLAKHLIKAGNDCSLVAIAHNHHEIRKSIGYVGAKVIAFRPISYRFHLPLIRPLALWREVGNAGIVHLMNHWTLINALVFTFAVLRKIPVVLCPAGALRIVGRSKILKKLYALIVGDRMIRRAAGVIIIADNERAHFSTHARAKSIRLIPNGIDPSELNDTDTRAFRRQFCLPAEAPLILFMGRLNAIKGPDILLKAFLSTQEDLSDYHLVFAGPDDGMEAELKNICKSEGMGERVHFIGYVGGAQKSQAYHAASFLVIPSRQEAMSIVALEAGAAGTPVLLTDACGFDDVERIGGGKVVKATAHDIAKGMNQMAAVQDRLLKMGKNLQRYVLKHFSWPEIVRQHMDYFQQLKG